MSRWPQSPETSMAKMVDDLRKHSALGERTITFYAETTQAVLQIMEAEGLHTMPREITADDVWALLDAMAARRLAVATRKGYISALKKFCSHFGNDILDTIDIRWPQDRRPKVDWLTPEETRILLECEKTPLQELVVHLELCMGMRRVEVVRLRMEDIHDDGTDPYITAIGKGIQGGKLRSIPFARDTRKVLTRFLRHRDEQIATARARFPASTTIPANVVLWLKAGRLNAYSEEGWGLDKVVVDPLRRSTGISFSNHTLRRTFGRTLWRAGISLDTISMLMGHESTEQTRRYIGVDMDSMQAAMAMSPL